MMILFLNLLMVVLLFLVAWQDYKDREVSLWLFSVLVFSAILKLYLYGLSRVYIDVLINMGLLCVQLLALYLYFNFVRKLRVNEMIGLGDVLFFVIIALSFSVVYFLLFQVLSLVFALAISVLFRFRNSSFIPLAGIQAFCLSITVILAVGLDINFLENINIYLYLFNL